VTAIELDSGREAYSHRAWLTAYKSLPPADGAIALAAEDLELPAASA
jgi:hypothetical protein